MLLLDGVGGLIESGLLGKLGSIMGIRGYTLGIMTIFLFKYISMLGLKKCMLLGEMRRVFYSLISLFTLDLLGQLGLMCMDISIVNPITLLSLVWIDMIMLW